MSIVCALTVMACGSSAVSNPTPSIPDIWGVWMGLGGAADVDPRFRNIPFPDPQFTEWGAAESRRLASPITPGECNPWSPVMFMGGGGLFPIQILQGPNVIVIHHEAVTQPRRIYMDGRAHPAPDELLPSFLGHSIGRWEGDTLAIETRYFAATSAERMSPSSLFLVSPETIVVERIKRVSDDELSYAFTVEDPTYYTQPWKGETRLHRSTARMLEYACHEGNYSLPYALQGSRIQEAAISTEHTEGTEY
jgi:hypothetical protein